MPANEILTYREMCDREGMQTLQRGMNFRLRGKRSVFLMSRRRNAPYPDRIENEGKILIYVGHDAPKSTGATDTKTIDQPEFNPQGSLTQNGLFHQAAQAFRRGESPCEIVQVYEKIFDGVWVDNGLFQLIDSWIEERNGRRVFKFRLKVAEADGLSELSVESNLEHSRLIPSAVKAEVWRRDQGQCVRCGSKVNLHFDHIIPFSKGGTSLIASNIQLLCARHNLEKRDTIA